MTGNNNRKPKLNSELAMEIHRLMTEAEAAERSDTVKKEDSPPDKPDKSEGVTAEAAAAAAEKLSDTQTYVQTGTAVQDEQQPEKEETAVQDEPQPEKEETAVQDEQYPEGQETAVDSEDDNESSEKDDDVTVSADGGKKSGSALKIILIIIGILLLLIIAGIAGTYFYEAKRYESVFFDNTYINNIDVSYMTPEEVKAIIRDQCNNYEITVKSRYREDEKINAKDVGLRYVTGDEIDSILAGQAPEEFYFVKDERKAYEIPAMLALDEPLFREACSTLRAFDDTTVTESVNACLGDYDPATAGYAIIPETDGNKVLDKERVIELISEEILKLSPEVDLESVAECIYPSAEIRRDDPGLLFEKQKLDRFVKTSIAYKDSDIVLDGSIIKDWLIVDGLGVIRLDEDRMKAFVAGLAEYFDTVGKERPLKSWYGNETSVSGGTFGWKVDQEAELNELKVQIPESKVTEREPVYSSRGIVHGVNDWGDTYVEVNLAKQHLFFIKDGQLVTETDIVSGGLQRRAATPTGVYCINYKARNAVLRGPRRADGSYAYESPVSYWMPFNKGIGLHDASWRGKFGGNIYKYNGSHGCVNMPKKAAQLIFEKIEAGVPVLVYDDDFEVVKKETEKETEKETAAKKQTQNVQKKTAETAAQTQSQTQPETQSQTESQTQPEGMAGPGVTGYSDPLAGDGPGAQDQPEAEVTYNAENLPGEMQ